MLRGIVYIHSFFLPPRQTFPLSNSFVPQAEQFPELPSVWHIKSSLSLYLFLNFELPQGKSKEFSNQGMKVHIERASKNYVTKNTIKKQTESAWNFLQPQIQVYSSWVHHLFQNQYFIILFPPVFFFFSQPQGQDQQNGKQT